MISRVPNRRLEEGPAQSRHELRTRGLGVHEGRFGQIFRPSIGDHRRETFIDDLGQPFRREEMGKIEQCK